jgi:hypothetical protein
MVAKVIAGKTIRGVLNYNENKVQEGKAICLYAHNFPAEVDSLSFKGKLDTFYNYTSKNEKVKTNAVHISLSFDKEDKLDKDKLKDVATRYLDKIGFGNQPFLVYQHLDAAHPHVHVVTTNVQLNGKRIDLHNIGRNASGNARREIEREFRLVKADGRKVATPFLKPIDLPAAEYGKTETKRSISNIVNTVTRSYKFTSIHELNAILKQYNVVADSGRDGSIVRANNGLRYSIIDSKGQPIGIPIKASSIYGKPTLNFLQSKFDVNEILRSPHKERLKGLIDQELRAGQKSVSSLIGSLIRNDVYPVVRQNADGRVYGITFVDNQTKCVFNGSDLGKQYSAKAILDRLTDPPDKGTVEIPAIRFPSRSTHSTAEASAFVPTHQGKGPTMLSDIIGAHLDKSDVDSNLKKKRKKRRGKSI